MSKKILCIDDDQDILLSLETILKKNDYEVFTAETGEDGIKKAVQVKPDLILLDVMMETDTRGFHVAYEIREDESIKYTPIVMLSSINSKSEIKFNPEKDGEFLPVDDFIEKPINPDLLLNIVKKNLNLNKDEINLRGQDKK